MIARRITRFVPGRERRFGIDRRDERRDEHCGRRVMMRRRRRRHGC